MACWVCGAAGTWSLNAFHSLLGRTSFLFLTRVLLGTQWSLLVKICLSLRHRRVWVLHFVSSSFSFKCYCCLIRFSLFCTQCFFLVSSSYVRLVPGSCFLSCLLAWSVTFEVAHSSSLSDITSAVSLCGVFRFFLILVCCLTGFATLI